MQAKNILFLPFSLSLSLLPCLPNQGSPQWCSPRESKALRLRSGALQSSPRGAETANDGTRVKQHFAEAEQRPGRVSAQALRILLFTPSTLSSPHWAAAYAPVIPSDADLCQIGAGALTQKEKERESERETARCSLRPPSSPAATPRERSGIGLNKEASSDGQTVPAPPIQRVGIGWRCGWEGGIEERVGGEKRRRGVVYVTMIRFLYKPPRLIRGLRIKFTRKLTVTVWPSVNPHPPQHPRVTSCFHTFNGRTCVLTRITPRPPIIDKLGLLSV